MSASAMFGHLFLEYFSRRSSERIPESHLVMEASDQVDSFMASGHDDGILVPIHFYHALQASAVIKPGERVVELACGPANQLIRMAQLNPETQFVGLDASESMLDVARNSIAKYAIRNVELVAGDMAELTGFKNTSFDGVVCTMSLHHLPSLAALANTFSEVQRVLKPGGGLYICDFGRLKRKSTQLFFANDRSTEQSPQFTADYLESLAAAFSVAEMRDATSRLDLELLLYETVLVPFMVVIKSPDRRVLESAMERRAVEMYGGLSSTQQRDFHNIARWFRLAGYGLPFELD